MNGCGHEEAGSDSCSRCDSIPKGVHPVTKKQLKGGNRYCKFCKPAKVHAGWWCESSGFSHDYSCIEHIEQLKPYVDDGHRSEADYQTWMKL